MAEKYYQSLSTDQGRPVKDARLVIGAVTIKHKPWLSDEETVQQLLNEPYFQYFAGLAAHPGASAVCAIAIGTDSVAQKNPATGHQAAITLSAPQPRVH